MTKTLHGKPIDVGDIVVPVESGWLAGIYVVTRTENYDAGKSTEQWCYIRGLDPGIDVGMWHASIRKDEFLTEVYKNKGEK